MSDSLTRVIDLKKLRDEESYRSGVIRKGIEPELLDDVLQREEICRKLLQEVEELRRLVQTLTNREEEVLRLVATGASNKEISGQLFISELTVKMHLASIFRKLQVNDRTKAAILALKAGFGEE